MGCRFSCSRRSAMQERSKVWFMGFSVRSKVAVAPRRVRGGGWAAGRRGACSHAAIRCACSLPYLRMVCQLSRWGYLFRDSRRAGCWQSRLRSPRNAMRQTPLQRRQDAGHLALGPNLAYISTAVFFVAKATGGCMPIYDFVCTKCGYEFESLVRATEVPVCPECASSQVKKLLSLPAAQGKTKDM